MNVQPGALTALLQQLAAAPAGPPQDALPQLQPGQVIGRFELLRELGHGAFGVVWEALDRELKRKVAFKLVRPGQAGTGAEQLQREAEVVARLSHPNLVTLHDVGHCEQGAYLVLELLRGETLQARLDRGPVALKDALDIAVDVARGLAYAHAEGVVHRDLKPSNVFLPERGGAKILDFGMAHAFGRRRVSGGTPAYMAPEQWEENPEDERTDVFALGVMLHRMLSGEYPFPEDGGKWSSGTAKAPGLDVPGAVALGPLVGRMLEKAPRKRPRDGAEVLAALEQISAALLASTTTTHAARTTRRRTTLKDLVEELRRRRVFRVMVGYGVFSFAVLQVIEPVMHAYHWPDDLLTFVVTGLALGFPAAVILSWMFDLTAAGVLRTPSATGPRALSLSRGRLAALLLGIGLISALPGVGWYAWRARSQVTAPPGAEAPAGPSVAVLPFLNMSGDPENEYFSDGLSEEILNALAQVPGLRVPARTSSFAFKGKTQDVARIAEALHVTTVLEGSVRKVGGRVRITAQLVGASDGYHLWSQSYDRELKDVFAIQDELAAAIAGALKLQLRPTAAGAEKRSGGTSNSEAYEAYLKGRQALNDRTRASIEKALLHFERATALDPSFALAHADAAIATVLLGNGEYGVGLAMPVAIARARSSLEKARAVAPNHPEVLAAAGLIERFDLHPEQSLALFDRSLAINPSSAEVLYWRKGALEDLDRYDEALPAMAAALRADPLSKIVLLNYVGTLESLGRVAEADAAAVRLRGLDESWGQQALGELAAARADHVAVVRHLLPAVQQGRSAVWPLATTLAGLGLVGEGLRVARDEPWDVYWVAGDLRRALEATEGPARQFPDDDLAQNCHFYSLYLARRFTEAAEIAAQIFHDGRGRWLSPGNLLQLAAAAREAGRVEEAGRYRDVAARRLEQSVRTGLTESSLRYTQASLAAYDGRDDEALALVSGPLSAPPFPCNHTDLSLPVYFSRIAGRPEFQAALRRIDAGLAEQRTRVLALLCGPERPSATWQPLPETCAGYTGPR